MRKTASSGTCQIVAACTIASLSFVASASAQVGVWGFKATTRLSCKPALPPFPRRGHDQGTNTVTFHADGTYLVPRGYPCPATDLPAEDAIGTWTRDGNRLILTESGTVGFFANCFDVQLQVGTFDYALKLTGGGRKFRGKLRLVGSIARGSLVSQYRETERLKGAFLSDVPADSSTVAVGREAVSSVGGSGTGERAQLIP